MHIICGPKGVEPDASPQTLNPYGTLITFDGLPRVRYAHPRL